EYTGSYISRLDVQQRMIFSLLTTEMGGTCGLIAPDEVTLRYMEGRSRRPFVPVYGDPDVAYVRTIEIDVSSLDPQVAVPPQPTGTRPLTEAEGTEIQQAYIGGCTGGGIADMRMAAGVLRGRKAHPEVRLIVVPGTQAILDEMLREGLFQVFSDAGAMVTPHYCGPCQMLCVGNLGEGETMIGTHPRNSLGRTGKGTHIYLASPYSCAASAVAGKIMDPRLYL
ncbi:MAG: 3-isopropylmalate dehydratase large subunit, partial [Deltaproteobacteria bacterium]|nr:3-isopropylmalate dehydratase large subunit [Deltaproteobacteria bacterium]